MTMTAADCRGKKGLGYDIIQARCAHVRFSSLCVNCTLGDRATQNIVCHSLVRSIRPRTNASGRVRKILDTAVVAVVAPPISV